MRVKEEIKNSGYFWLPSLPDKKIPGTLFISDGGEIELEVIGLFDESPEGINSALSGNQNELERIVGHIEKYGLVTLDVCFYKNRNISSGGISKSRIHVCRALLGVAYEDKETVQFNTFKFSVEGIDEWVGISGIKVELRLEERSATVAYSPPEEVLHHLDNGMKLIITYSYTLPGFPNIKEAKVTQKTFFKLVSEQGRPLDDFISVAHKITTLLCFAIDKTVCIEQVSAASNSFLMDKDKGESRPIWVPIFYASLPFSEVVPKIEWHNMFFTYVQIQANAEQMINNWINAYEEIRPAMSLYFSTKTGAQKFLDGKFLALAQGLETFHRRKFEEKLMEEKDFKGLLETLINLCPEKNQEWLAGRLEHGNEVNLSRRLKSLIEPFNELFGTSRERSKFIRSIVNTRNYLTHFDQSLQSEATKGKELWSLCFKMEAIFQLLFLNILGFTQEEILSVVNGNNYLGQKLKTTRHRGEKGTDTHV